MDNDHFTPIVPPVIELGIALFFVLAGAYNVWIFPYQVRGRIKSGLYSAKEGASKLKMVRTCGVVMIIGGIGKVLLQLF